MKKLYEEENVRAIADAIRAKTGKTGKMKLADMTSEVDTVSTFTMLKNYIEGNLTEIELLNVTKVCAGALIASSLKKISLPNVTELSKYSFTMSTAEEIKLDNLETISAYSFFNAYGMSNGESETPITVIAPKVKTVSECAFNDCYVDFSFENVESIGYQAFAEDWAIKTVDAPKLTSLGEFAFAGAGSITNVSLPSLSSLEKATFSGCESLANVHIPNVTSIGSQAFGTCYSLAALDLPAVTAISEQAFNGCGSLTRLILRSEVVCALPDIKASASNYPFKNCYHFAGTTNSDYNPDGHKDGHIYVPSALVATYQTATGWKTLANDRFRALEDFTVDGTTTGALDDSKIAAADEEEYTPVIS
jgi:hypothetical protein